MYTKKFKIFALICILLCSLFAVALLMDGPRIRKASYDSAKLTQDTNQTITLKANQPIKSISQSQITISPSAEFSAVTAGENIVIQVKERLLNSTNYTLEVKAIESQNGKKTDYKATIQTPSSEFYYLKRAKGAERINGVQDRIIDSKDSSIVYSNEKIYGFELTNKNYLTVHHGSNDKHQISIIDLSDNSNTSAHIPEDIDIEKLQSSPTKNIFGFTATSQGDDYENKKYTGNLFLYDIEAKVISAINGLDDKPLSVVNWQFSPDGTTILAQTYDSGVLLIDSTDNHKPIPLGTFNSIGNFSGDGSQVSLTDPINGNLVFDIKTKEKYKPYKDGNDSFLTSIYMLSRKDKMIRKIDSIDTSSNDYSSTLDFGVNPDFKKIFEMNSNNSDLVNFSASKNDQYIVLEISDMDGNQKYDNYSSNSAPFNIKTEIIDVNNGSIFKEVDGFNVRWKKH